MTENHMDAGGGADAEMIDSLKQCGLLHGINADAIADIAAMCRVLPRSEGEIVFDDNDPGQNLYYIKSGKVSIILEAILPNVELSFLTFEAGDVFGELAFADGKPRSAKARCAADCVLIVINGFKLKEYLALNTETGIIFYKNLAGVLAKRMRRMNHKVLTLFKDRQFQ